MVLVTRTVPERERRAYVYSLVELTNAIRPVVVMYGARKVILYGSYARGEATAQSDVDLYIVAGEMGLLEASAMSFDINDALNSRASVTFEEFMDIPDEFRKEIARDGVVLYE